MIMFRGGKHLDHFRPVQASLKRLLDDSTEGWRRQTMTGERVYNFHIGSRGSRVWGLCFNDKLMVRMAEATGGADLT